MFVCDRFRSIDLLHNKNQKVYHIETILNPFTIIDLDSYNDVFFHYDFFSRFDRDIMCPQSDTYLKVLIKEIICL